MLLDNGIALWDSIASCDIIGSSDSSIKNVVPNDLTPILEESDIKAIFTNGKTSDKYFKKYNPTLSAICLPSTSPANASRSIEVLVDEWKIIKNYL